MARSTSAMRFSEPFPVISSVDTDAHNEVSPVVDEVHSLFTRMDALLTELEARSACDRYQLQVTRALMRGFIDAFAELDEQLDVPSR